MTFHPYVRPKGYNWDGEPRLVVDSGGTSFEMYGGQPVMDAGIENAALISLLTKRGWFGNQFLEADYQIGDSDFESVCSDALTKTTFVRAEAEAQRALKWMVDEGIASEIRADVANRQGLGVDVTVTIVRPNGSTEDIQLRRFGENWMRQCNDPASARLREDYGAES